MLNNIGLPGLLLIAVVVLVLFGRGKISSLMGEVGKGITAFKKGVKDGSEEIENNLESARDVTPEATEKDKV
ncbi:MAG: Sec-independent protein translocase TatA [Confluentimicrobium sp.]|jgi:sec-independent protein translocase protein TatA|uniref:Sec-independent protein translocase protein TatA n=1 Tax=Actibacterium naphthalenivorans TaxID=1614693 RepID=A0A840C3T9_9RHOB|nr:MULTISPECIES: twin-arginine translocase TatA/TatE family subunit [Actibacterium]KGB81598.1 prohead protease [Rhodovulum sp. NI22]MDY6859756.1 twin-arginine translocase TatA/TatE family subunit [Pseudomonadota bacterium]ALG89907.1 prohead protease [Actibacterium sp. EMB200-NS6]MBB4020364.1 sec-independent protein translocase protein TatA [Actibacterium naphthalenivorans]MBC55905.1 Sec-independent protein translocase TatA [Actibacterium sp.]|tara:strand:- start:480 stop:695 length:216 start_codon:yes stop_codon:yes gene_type:complete